MTRGFFVVADGTKIETAIYINGSAYPSYEGVKILEALTSQSGDPYQGGTPLCRRKSGGSEAVLE